MPDPAIHLTVRIPSPLCAELPYLPFLAVFVVKEFDELVEGVAVGSLGVGAAGARGCDDEGCYVAEVESGFRMARAWPCYDLAEEGCHGVGYWETGWNWGILVVWYCGFGLGRL